MAGHESFRYIQGLNVCAVEMEDAFAEPEQKERRDGPR